MAPEALLGDTKIAAIKDLKNMDVWSFGMLIFNLLNPDACYPYAAELVDVDEKLEFLKLKHSFKQLPEHNPKYNSQRENEWQILNKVFLDCSTFNADERPNLDEIYIILERECFTNGVLHEF